MPKRLDYKFKRKFETEQEMVEFRENHITKGKFHNNKVPCTFHFDTGIRCNTTIQNVLI